MVDATILTACRDVIAVVRDYWHRHHCRDAIFLRLAIIFAKLWKGLHLPVSHLPASSFQQHIGRGEMSLDCPTG